MYLHASFTSALVSGRSVSLPDRLNPVEKRLVPTEHDGGWLRPVVIPKYYTGPSSQNPTVVMNVQTDQG